MELKAKEKPKARAEGSTVTWAAAISRLGFLPVARQSRPQCSHLPAIAVHPGKPLPIEIAAEAGFGLARIRLHYRHVDQSDAYEVVEMSQEGARFKATIPAEYTKSPYPLLYYFEVHDSQGHVWMYPGLNPDLANQPYFVVRHA